MDLLMTTCMEAIGLPVCSHLYFGPVGSMPSTPAPPDGLTDRRHRPVAAAGTMVVPSAEGLHAQAA